MPVIVELIKTIVIGAIFFVWVVRYDNIKSEFAHYQLPDWLRDLVGIFKLSFSLMLLSSNSIIVVTGAVGIAVLMLAAQFTHVRVKSVFSKMLPSLVLLICCVFIASQSMTHY